MTHILQIAVISTTPWDSYLIHNHIWTYPSHAILGPTLFSIPAEEIFFFVVQTYNTSLLYLLLSTPTFHPVYLCGDKRLSDGRLLWLWAPLGQGLLVATILAGLSMIVAKGEGLYMGLILAWAGPFVLLLWYDIRAHFASIEPDLWPGRTLAHQFILGLPLSNTLLPVALPTLYLWVVDTWALKRGTWVIESGTKLGLHLWDGLEIEYASSLLGQLLYANSLQGGSLLSCHERTHRLRLSSFRQRARYPANLPKPFPCCSGVAITGSTGQSTFDASKLV